MKRILLLIVIGIISCAQTDSSIVRNNEDSIVRRIRGAQYIKHTDYVLQYSEEHEQAYYVAYILTKRELQGRAQRRDNFRMDPLVTTQSAAESDYTNTGFDKGHLAPAADMVENQRDMDESFYMSNMSPQDPSFNRGIWAQLEDKAREWAVKNGRVVIVTGPILRGKMRTIGRNNVAVPKYFYKIILDIDKPSVKAIGFIIPNRRGTKSLESYAVSVDTVEYYTGLDFFPFLNDSVEEKLEGSADYSVWE